MDLTSDLILDVSKFLPENVTEETKSMNGLLEKVSRNGPKWHEVGVEKYRLMRETGETPLPVPVYLPNALDETVPSREATRQIPLRVYKPDNGQPSKGIFLHIHGGGFVLATHKHSDHILQRYANRCQLTAISVGYRLAPEHPYPAAADDCADVATYLVDNAEERYGAKLMFIGGESAGAYLSVQSVFHLIRTRPEAKIAGLILPFGHFDLTLGLPTISSSTRPVVINRVAMAHFTDAYTPDMSITDRQNGAVSPLYEDLYELAQAAPDKVLPPALFLVGTADPLLDDTLLMSMKWMMTGSEAILKVFPGAPHGFTAFPNVDVSEKANRLAMDFVLKKVDQSSRQ